MAQDPYRVLGVSRTASSDDIRAAYRRMAKQYHPDRNQGNAAAEDKFKAANAAFEIVGDTDKRSRFDRGEIDADGNERMAFSGGGGGGAAGASGGAHYRTHRHAPGSGGNFEDFGDIFADFFGRGGGGGRGKPQPQRGGDIRYRLSVDFLDAARGATKRVGLPDGRGIDVTIPEGIRDGQTLRLKGQGERGQNRGPAGDVLVEVTVKPHPIYSIAGDDLTIEVPVTLKEAVMGGKIEIPTLRGMVTIRLPANTSSGISFRLREKGLKNPKTGEIGDLYAKVRIVLPEHEDGALRTFVESWDDPSPNPRDRLKESAV